MRERSAGPSAKKGKSSGGKKGEGSVTTYVANADALIGTNPIADILECWDNNNAKLGLNFVEYSAPAASSITIPDSMFYCLLGVTVTVDYDVTFDDYGGPGPQTYSGSFELPLWNRAYSRPNPGSDFDPLPYFYHWTPASGPTISFEYVDLPGSVNFYYAAMLPSGDKVSGSSTDSGVTESGPTPLAALRLTFESELGTGPEFDGNDRNGNPYNLQQILYPHYAGVGSANLDLGAAGVAPAMRFEIFGTYPYNPSGDADFADMIVDIFGKAANQAAFAADIAYSQVQHALACYDYPAVIYKKSYQLTSPPNPIVLTYDQPNTAGNMLVAALSAGAGSIDDTTGNIWQPVFTNGEPCQVWYSIAAAAAANKVTINLSGSPAQVQVALLEIGGVDTFDRAVAADSGEVNITTSNAKGTPGYLLAFTNYESQYSGEDPGTVHWTAIETPGTEFLLQSRTVQTPGTYSLSNLGNPSQIAILAFKCSQPPNYPKPLGNILDGPSLLLCREQCRANGLIGSLIMDSQQQATEWLKDLYTAMNAAPVWSGFTLKSIPYSEVSAVGNGAIYIAPTASGPVANLTEDDLIGDAGSPLVSVERKAQVDIPNLLQLQTPNRASEYNTVVTSQPESASIALFGQRKADPQTLNCVQDVAVARMILSVMVRRQNYIRNTYKFKLKAKWKLLEPMDLVTINDSLIGISNLPVRLTSIAEDDQYNLDCEAEPFFYGVNAPTALTVTAPAPYVPSTTDTPANVNAPIFIEPVLRLTNNVSQLWIVVSDADPNYGGCQVFLSTDGDSSYPNVVGTLTGSAITGVLTADWPPRLIPIRPTISRSTSPKAMESSLPTRQSTRTISPIPARSLAAARRFPTNR